MDEGHALRTPDTTWYRAAARLLGGQQKDLALLTATPINNGLWDLYHLVMSFAHHDRAFASHGIPSLRRLFLRAGANERDPENLNPDVLFSLADMVSVRRDRRFIEQHYSNESFPDGTLVTFPTPFLSTERYDLDASYPGLVQAITTHIEDLTMARYRPSSYRLDEQPAGREASLSALLQSAVLKRFESCWYACLLTIDRMIAAHDAFLNAWDQGRVLSGDALTEAASADLDETGLSEWLSESLDEKDSEPVSRFKPGYRDHVDADRRRLQAVAEALGSLQNADDPKLALLRQLLEDTPSEKVIVFSAFADTVRYIDDHLPYRVDGRDRVTVIGAETNPDERTRLLARFCPDTVVHPGYEPTDGEVDLMLGNDVLSEGQNLQQAAAVISYDMPWNPQRVVQRYGRVVRLKSPHREVSLITMLPEQGDLERLLRLEVAIRRKIVAARPYGMEIEVMEGDVDEEIQSYARRLAEGDVSLIDEPDAAGMPQALSAELLRAELRRAGAEGELNRARELPWGVGAAFAQGPDIPSVGPAGVFFACRTRDGERHWRYITNRGDIASAPPVILRRINPGQASGVSDPPIDLEAAWSAVAASIMQEHNDDAGHLAGRSLGSTQQWAREVLDHPDVSSIAAARAAYEALEIERGSQIRRALGNIRREHDRESTNPTEAARQIIDLIEFYGLRDIDTSAPAPEITEDDIGVVCWMAVLPEQAKRPG